MDGKNREAEREWKKKKWSGKKKEIKWWKENTHNWFTNEQKISSNSFLNALHYYVPPSKSVLNFCIHFFSIRLNAVCVRVCEMWIKQSWDSPADFQSAKSKFICSTYSFSVARVELLCWIRFDCTSK